MAMAMACTGSGGASDAGGDCEDTQTDPFNCGSCGRVCIVPMATAACSAGDCVIDACDEGYFDEDGDVLNGCEFEGECSSEQACYTTCGSEGTQECVGGLLGACEAPAEACNSIDDNCDGQCDEGAIADCRVGVHRSSGGGHLYTTDLVAAGTDPFHVESENYFYFYSNEQPGTQVVFLCKKPNNKFFITSSTNCETNGGIQATLGYWATAEQCGAVPLYRLWHSAQDNHFYTKSASERDNAINNLGYVQQSPTTYVWQAP